MDTNLAADEEPDVWNQVVPALTPVPEKAPPHHRARARPGPGPVAPRPIVIDEEGIVRVAASSSPQAVASSIRAIIFDTNTMPVVRAIGAGAVCQAVKAIAIARGHVAVRGLDLATTVGFDTVPGDLGQDISAQVFRLFTR